MSARSSEVFLIKGIPDPDEKILEVKLMPWGGPIYNLTFKIIGRYTTISGLSHLPNDQFKLSPVVDSEWVTFRMVYPEERQIVGLIETKTKGNYASNIVIDPKTMEAMLTVIVKVSSSDEKSI